MNLTEQVYYPLQEFLFWKLNLVYFALVSMFTSQFALLLSDYDTDLMRL